MLPPLHVNIAIAEQKDGGPYELKITGDRRLRTVRPKLADVLFLAHRVIDELEESELAHEGHA
ncbi:MAG TPA: hypothetical protein VFO27_04790 [Bryobacteraceae bacterium]|nr:hypothetical protein [Bryobacteraceae bacterium]